MNQSIYFRLLQLATFCLLVVSSADAQSGTAYYSSFAAPTTAQYRVTQPTAAVCALCRVYNPARAADTDLNNYAVIQNTASVLGTGVGLALKLSGTAPVGYRAGFIVSNGSTLDANVLSALTVRTYRGGVQQQQVVASNSLVRLSALSDSRYQLEFVAAQAFDEVELVVGGLASVANTVRVLYAYGVDSNTQPTRALGYLSRNAATAGSFQTSTAASGPLSLCANSQVSNPERAVDTDITNYATLTTDVGVGACTVSLRTKLEGTAAVGYEAGFVVGNGGLLDLNLLPALTITTYQNGQAKEVKTGISALSLNLLPDNKYFLSFTSTQAFDAVEITQGGLVSVLNTLRVYYGFGIEPSAFRDQDPVLSDFTTPQRGTEYQSTYTPPTVGVCLGCSNTGESRASQAADNTIGEDNYAQVMFPTISVGASYRLKLRLNGTGKAGNRAGIVFRSNSGPLDLNLLQNITLTTYRGAAGTTQAETFSGAGLLDLGLINDNRRAVSFLTTQDFDWVELNFQHTAGVSSDLRVYYAFAEDPFPGFPAEVGPAAPLPVALTFFQAKANGQSTDVTWRTASELNNSHFVVERARQATAEFQAIGQVQGAGTSATGQAYSFRDDNAATLGSSTLYYRLRQVDTDGKTTFSPVAVVSWKNAVALQVYPNPAASSEQVSIQLNSSEAAPAATLLLYDMRGVLLRKLPATQPVLTLAGAALPAGLYQLVLSGPSGQPLGSQRLVVTGR